MAPAFTALGSAISWAEVFGFVLSLWMVICNMRVNPLAWPLAIVASLLYFLLFRNGKLYGEAGLQLLFVVLALWGWWQWLRGTGTMDGPCGQWLLARKYQENWAVWIIVNIVSVALFAFKGYWLTVVLYALFIPLSVMGWRAWSRQLSWPR